MITKLTAIGMSSEEEAEVEFMGQPTKMYKVKICLWRAPEIADYVRLIDTQMETLNKQQSRLSHRSVRVPVQEYGTSAAPKGLPKCLYSDEWLDTLTPLRYEELQISEEAFALLVAATSRMVL